MGNWLLLFGDVQRVGGTERRMAEVASALSASGETVTVLFRTTITPESVRSLYEKPGVNIVHEHRWKNYAQKAASLGANGTILAFGLKQSLVARVLKIWNRKTLTHIHARNGLDYTWPSYYHVIDRLTSNLVDYYLANSESVAQHLRSRGISGKKIKVLRSALPSEWFEPPYEDYHSPTNVVRLIMVGNARPEKNQLPALKAIRSLDVPTVTDIYTDNGRELKTLIARMPSRYSDITIHEGAIVGPADYDRADILLHPSISESLPRAVLEAKTRGCRVIATDVGDTKYITDESLDTILDPSASVEEMKYALQNMINNISCDKQSKGPVNGTNSTEISKAKSISDYVASVRKIAESDEP